MTREQLRIAISDFTGLNVQDDAEYERKMIVRSPTGLVVSEFTVFDDGERGWCFGGCTMAFPASWKALCRIHEVAR